MVYNPDVYEVVRAAKSYTQFIPILYPTTIPTLSADNKFPAYEVSIKRKTEDLNQFHRMDYMKN